MYSGGKIQASGYLANTTEPANGERGAGAARRRTVAGKERRTGFEKKSEGAGTPLYSRGDKIVKTSMLKI